MPSRGKSREETSPRNDITRGEFYSGPEQQHSEADLSSDGPPPQGAASHPNRAFRVCDTDSSYTGNGPFLSTKQVSRAVRTQGFPDHESGISPDGFPSRSVEDGGVSGLFSQRESTQVSIKSTSSDTPNSSPLDSGCAEPSTSEVYDASFHTARAVTLLRLRLDRPEHEAPGEHRLPSPATLDRIDDGIEDSERIWTNNPRRAARQTQQSNQREDDMLTGGSETSINPRNSRAPDLRGVGQRGSKPASSRPHHTESNAPRHTGRTGEYPPAGATHTRPQRVSSTPSETSITDTVLNAQPRTTSPRTPTQPQSDRALLPSRRQQATAAAGSSRGLTRGPSYPAPVAAQEELVDVPAVLVPGGLFGLGGSQSRPPPQVLRRQGQGGSGEDKKGKGRERHKE